MSRRAATLLLLASSTVALAFARPQDSKPAAGNAPAAKTKAPLPPQPRPHGQRVGVDPALIRVDDGDTVEIAWPGADAETVRILGIDSPETQHVEHGIPIDQAYGHEARAFCQGAFAAATEVELLRASTLDPYGRTLGYLFINGRNYSLLILNARLAQETVGYYGDNGLPTEAAQVLDASKRQGPLPFEPPHVFRARMRKLSDYNKANAEH
jgi:endonuclease YncB( thermonuclease family)